MGEIVNLTKQKETEKDLLESNNKYRASFNNANDAINIFSKEKKIAEVK